MFSHIPATALPPLAGIGLRAPHIREVQERLPVIGWLEVHAENYMTNGVATRALARLRESYPLSLHGVGLSLGSAGGIDAAHLNRLAEACHRFEPDAVSEHLSWSSAGGHYLNDLLPVPYDAQSLRVVCANVQRTQDILRRPILIENLSAYVSYRHSTMSEPEFLTELVKRTGCGLLLDINNVYVSARNLGFDPEEYVAELPFGAIGEIHLAGHATNQTADGVVLIDNHGSCVPSAVWSLYAKAVSWMGRRPTLIEWDTALPPLDTLLGEAMWADLLAGAVSFTSSPGSASLPVTDVPAPLKAAAAELLHA
jgi:uncharacterized protein (UPF0276 family)